VVEVLVILDGASEPLNGGAPTSLQRGHTPALDALAARGRLSRLRTVPAGLPVGSEVAIPVLLGWTPAAIVDRGSVEAAAHAIEVPAGSRAWRVDVLGADGRGDPAAALQAQQALRDGAPAHDIHLLAGHRLLVVGDPPMPDAVRIAQLRVWPEGGALAPVLDDTVVVIAARGAAAGAARLMGARVVVPDGATGGADSDLSAKAASAETAIAAGAERVVVHVGGLDAAAHALDADLKVAVLERADRELIAPLAAGVRTAGGSLRVCADHGCDPRTGAHTADPVPCVDWPGTGVDHHRRLTEDAVISAPLIDLTTAPVAA
jgi:2,3-bisphosphoglycerate-independent phosphoglycerate mutase